MPEIYTIANFDPSVIPSGFNKQAQVTMRGAVAQGWKLVVTNSGHCTLVAPPPNEHITINVSQRKSDGPVRQIRQRIEKYANPLLAMSHDPKDDNRTASRILTAETAAERNRAMAAASSVRTESDKPKPISEMEFESADEPLELPTDEVTYEKPTAEDRASRHIVSSGPMISRRSNRRGYVSEIATQREWSDGTIDYVCTVEGCTAGPDGGPFVSENRMSMGPHRKAHINSGETDLADQDRSARVEIPDHEPAYTKGYAPRDDRLRSLSVHLLAALVHLGPDVTDSMRADALAKAALEWSHERTQSGLTTEREPLSDADLLAKIRGMLDNGLYQRQQDEMAALRAAKDEADAKAEAAESEAQRVKDDLSGMLDLLAEYRSEDKA